MTLEHFLITNHDLYPYSDLFNKYGIDTYQDLYHYVVELKIPELQKDKIIKALYKRIELNETNKWRLMEMPEFKTYENTSFNTNSLNRVDESNKGVVLPYKRPSEFSTSISRTINNMSIGEIKYRLTHVSAYGKNLISGVGEVKKVRLIDCIKFYENHIITLAEYKSMGNILSPEIFFTDYNDKKKIVIEYKNDIVQNLLDGANDFVFGPASDSEKERMLDYIKKGNNKTTNEFIDLITNYSLLDELEKNPANPSVVKRLRIY